MLTRYQADLHVHTLLSPCGEVEMIPSLIVAAAQMAGLDMIAIADHNSCENARAVVGAADGTGVKVFCGMEVQSVEGVHVLCLFDTPDQSEALQEAVYSALPTRPGYEKFFDQQMVVDSNDEFVRYCDRLLALPTSLDIDDIHERATALEGLVLPSHIDRSSTGICDVLGMLPENPDFDAVEVSANITPEQARGCIPSIRGRAIFRSSDAHWLSAIGTPRTVFELAHRSIEEIRLACRGEDGRRVVDA